MASNSAFTVTLPPLSHLTNGHESLGRAMDAVSDTAVPAMDSPALKPRMLSGAIENLRGLGIEVDGHNKTLNALRIAIITNYSLYSIYSAYRAYVAARASRETAIAAGETAAAMAAQQWHKLAMAAAAAAMAYGAFRTGEKFGSGDWNLPRVDTSIPASRRAAARAVVDTGA